MNRRTSGKNVQHGRVFVTSSAREPLTASGQDLMDQVCIEGCIAGNNQETLDFQAALAALPMDSTPARPR